MINLDEGCKWEITKVTQRRRVESYSCNSNDIYEDIHYSITVKRKIPAYHSVIVIPALGDYFNYNPQPINIWCGQRTVIDINVKNGGDYLA